MKNGSLPNKKTRQYSIKENFQCYECFGFNHIASECTNRKNKFNKAMVATWDDESDESDDESLYSEDESLHTYKALTIFTKPSNDIEENYCNNSEEEKSDEEDLLDAYNELCNKSV